MEKGEKSGEGEGGWATTNTLCMPENIKRSSSDMYN